METGAKSKTLQECPPFYRLFSPEHLAVAAMKEKRTNRDQTWTSETSSNTCTAIVDRHRLEMGRNGQPTAQKAEVDMKVHLARPKTTTWRVEAIMELPLEPNQVYDILVDPSKERIFKDVKKVNKWQVIEDDGIRQVVQVEQISKWKYMCFCGTYSSHMKLEQDRKSRTIKFSQFNSGDSQTFEGVWVVEEKQIDTWKGNKDIGLPQNQVPSGTSNPSISSIKLVQQLSLSSPPPSTVSRLIGHITANAAKGILRDIYEEADRICEGRPIEQPAIAMDRQFYWKDKSMRRRRRLRKASPFRPPTRMMQA